MELLKEDFQTIAGFEAKTSISIYLPVHRSGVEVNEMQDALVLKNKLLQIRKTLTDKGEDQATIENLLKNGFDLIEQRDFWNEQENGLALFLSEGFFKWIKMPFAPKEELFINSTFYVTPLLGMLKDEKFYLLHLSRHDARFYRGDTFGMKKLDVEGLPNGMNDVIHYEEKGGKQLMRRSGAGTGRNAVQGASFHGHGAGLSDDTEYLITYLKEVDQTLWTQILSTERSPLILAGVDYIIAHYKQISSYKLIAEETLTGNFEREDEHTLFDKAKEKLSAYFEEHTNKALKTYYDNSSGAGLSSPIPEDVIPASFYGKVSDLFVLKDEHIWGNFDEIKNELIIHEELGDRDTCLINKAVVKTIQNGGEVHVLEKEKMPSDAKIAAFMRY